MKARQLVNDAVSGPALRVIAKAFDDAWFEIADRFDRDGPAREAARLRLAHVILAIARPDGNNSSEQLKDAALHAMATNDRAVPHGP